MSLADFTRPGIWTELFPYALELMDHLETVSDNCRWTFGGGTVLMLRINHRHSKDIDLFVSDPQFLPYVSPRLSGEREAVIVAQFETLEIKGVTSESLMQQLSERLPSTCRAIDETSKFILAPSIAFSKFEVDLPDYSSFTHSALRGLEACLKHLLNANGIVAKAQEGMNHFFDKTSQTLKPEFSRMITSSQTIGAMHDFYRLYARNRKALFHADGAPVTSRIIEKRGEAVGIIDSVFITLEKGFGCIETGRGYV